MNGLLVRVGIDQSEGGGQWNAPCSLGTGSFVYVPIPEIKTTKEGLGTPYSLVLPALNKFNSALPAHLSQSRMHLDPDFQYSTYGDHGNKGRQIENALGSGDLLIFYSGLRDKETQKLVYALIGFFVIDHLKHVADIPEADAYRNAHTRRILSASADDLVIFGKPGESGRLIRCIPIGENRDGAYRIRRNLLDDWDGISSKDGWLQRSATFPRLLNVDKFLCWWYGQNPELVASNNPD